MKSLRSRGFTMIELLIVISVLGILAAGVLAAVDPFEQLKKARDTNNRQSVLALQTAFIRYYATHGALPWDNAAVNVTATCGTGTSLFGATRSTAPTPISLIIPAMGNVTTPGTTCVGLLESEGELKPGFVGAVGSGVGATIFVTSKTAADVTVCYSPASKSIYAEDNTKFDSAGIDLSIQASPKCSAATKAAGTQVAGDNVCYYCAK